MAVGSFYSMCVGREDLRFYKPRTDVVCPGFPLLQIVWAAWEPSETRVPYDREASGYLLGTDPTGPYLRGTVAQPPKPRGSKP